MEALGGGLSWEREPGPLVARALACARRRCEASAMEFDGISSGLTFLNERGGASMAGETVTRARLSEAVYQEVGLSAQRVWLNSRRIW